MKESVTDNDLMTFCEWFAAFHGNTAMPSVFTTCLCGYFHTYTKAAKQVLTRCKELKLVTVKGNHLTIIKFNIKDQNNE